MIICRSASSSCCRPPQHFKFKLCISVSSLSPKSCTKGVGQRGHMTAEECLFSCWIQRPFISFKKQKRYETPPCQVTTTHRFLSPVAGCSMWYNSAWYCRFASSWHLDHATCCCFISCLLHSGLMQLKMPCLSR